jgi:superfamily II DNA or RNA helicase
MPIKSNTQEFIAKSKAKFGEILDYSLVDYKSSRIPVILGCSIHGLFEVGPNLHLHSLYPCPKCAHGVPTTDQYIVKAKEIHGDKFDYSRVNYVARNIKVEIVCRTHGSFYTLPDDHTRYSTGGCVECAGNQQLTTEQFIAKAHEFHGIGTYDYSVTEYIDNHTKVKIVCHVHGEFWQLPTNHYKYGCIKCSGKFLKDNEDFKREAIIVHQGKYTYENAKYVGAFVKVEVTCPNHGPFWILPTNHVHGTRGCPKCSGHVSIGETKWLDSLGIPNDSSHRSVYLNVSGAKYYVDGFDPDTLIVYEYDGDYWHGNPKIYEANKIHPEAKKTFGELWKRTVTKKKNLEEAGYKVISMWESDFEATQAPPPSKIIIANKYCQFVTKESGVFVSLSKFLSYRATGVEYTSAYKNGWDGFTRLLSKKGFFLAGLLPKVRGFLTSRGDHYSEQDVRAPAVASEEINLEERLCSLNLIPRDHQTKILAVMEKFEKGIVRACTGSGKTLCAALATAKFNKPTIIYVIGLDLLKQFHDLFSSLFDEPIGFIGDGVCQIERINIASIWTIGSALKLNSKEILVESEDENERELNPKDHEKIVNMLWQSKIHIFDESHVVTTSTISQIYKHIEPERIYGFSGTPFRDDNTDLLINGILGEQIINVSASELIERGLLAQPIIKFVNVPSLASVGSTYPAVYEAYITNNEIRNQIIVLQVLELLQKGYTPLILFRYINHGNKLHEMMLESGIKCELLNGNDSLERRTQVKEMLSSRKIQAVLASTIFDLGIDLPILSALVLCGSGKSSIRTLQRIGRVIRAFPGKKFAAVVDFYDQAKFLKKHSNLRYRIYSGEQGFKVIKCKGMA